MKDTSGAAGPQTAEWRPAPDFEGYEVSNWGEVRSWFIREGVKRRVPLYRKPCLGRNGYMAVTLCRNSHTPKQRVETWTIHRLVMMAFKPRPDAAELDVSHIDGNKENNRLWNLEWATRKQNEARKLEHGTRASGSRNGQSKLDERMARAIRDLHKFDGLNQRLLAERFGICQQNVAAIIAGRTWKSS